MIMPAQKDKEIWQERSNPGQSKIQRIILLSVLGYEAAGCLLGGSFLIAAPDGRLMDMPTSIMHGTFRDFLIPGIILFILGILNTGAFVSMLRKRVSQGIWAILALGGLAIWFWVEIAILQRLHWLHAMWGLPVVLGFMMIPPLFRKQIVDKFLLFCGILSSLLYLAINIIVPLQWREYNIAAQTVSELSAIGAPTRTLWLVLSTPYTLLVVAFAIGVWKSAGNSRLLRITGVLLFIYGALGVLWPFAPMHQREVLAAGGHTISDTMHLSLGAITEIIYLIALCIAGVAVGRIFRLYSVLTLIVLFVFGFLTFLDAPKIAVNQATPMAGIWERVNIAVFLLWVVVFAIILMNNHKGRPIKDL